MKGPVVCPTCGNDDVEHMVYSEQVITHRYCRRLRKPDERDEGTAEFLIDVSGAEEIVADSGDEGMLACPCGCVFPIPANVAPWFG